MHLQLLLPLALATPSLDAGAGNVRLSPLSMAEEQQALPTVPMASQAGPMAAAILDENGQLVAPSAALMVLRTRLVGLIGDLQEISEIVTGMYDYVFTLEQELDVYLQLRENLDAFLEEAKQRRLERQRKRELEYEYDGPRAPPAQRRRGGE